MHNKLCLQVYYKEIQIIYLNFWAEAQSWGLLRNECDGFKSNFLLTFNRFLWHHIPSLWKSPDTFATNAINMKLFKESFPIILNFPLRLVNLDLWTCGHSWSIHDHICDIKTQKYHPIYSTQLKTIYDALALPWSDSVLFSPVKTSKSSNRSQDEMRWSNSILLIGDFQKDFSKGKTLYVS